MGHHSFVFLVSLDYHGTRRAILVHTHISLRVALFLTINPLCISGNVYICLLLSLHLLCLCLLICLFSVSVLSACFSSPGTMLIKAHTTGNE